MPVPKKYRQSRFVTEGYVLQGNRKIAFSVATRSKLQARRAMKAEYPNGRVYITLTRRKK